MGEMTLALAVYGFLGLIMGYLLAKIAPEEMAPGRKYFTKALAFVAIAMGVSLILFSTANLTPLNALILAITVLGVISGLFYEDIYLMLGLGIAAASTIKLGIILASLIFVYGMLEGSLKRKKNIIFRNGIAYFAPIFLLSVFNFSIAGSGVVIFLVAGFLLAYAYKILRK
tara:strand:- start:150 stop:662 length:513 start_codon:yes stop_codon:yes gene_type:complete